MKNYWQSGAWPLSWHQPNSRDQWQGPDQPLALEQNPQADQWRTVNIEYCRNAQGFRTHDLLALMGQAVDVALGCSFTEGVAVPETARWPSIIERQCHRPLLNFGIGGASTDTVARILTNITDLYEIQSVFILWPELSRFEQYGPETSARPIISVTPQRAQIEHAWNMDHHASWQRYYRNRHIVQLLAQHHGFQIYEMLLDLAIKTIPFTPGRDGQHWGYESHVAMANWFMSQQRRLTT